MTKLLAGQSGDRIPVGRDFPRLSSPDLAPTQPPVKWVPDLIPDGKAAVKWHSPPTPIYRRV